MVHVLVEEHQGCVTNVIVLRSLLDARQMQAKMHIDFYGSLQNYKEHEDGSDLDYIAHLFENEKVL